MRHRRGRASSACTPETIDRSVHADEIQHIREVVADRIPALRGPLVHAATCMYTSTPDHHFVLGLHPGHANVIVASPCAGHGYKFASVIGEILADLALGAVRATRSRFSRRRGSGHTCHPERP